jgi:putative methionine-R-sulfoxide reductase with GAF domain
VKIVQNALTNVCLAGFTMAKAREEALLALKREVERGERNFVILLRHTRALNFHGLYCLDLQQLCLTKFHGMGPTKIGMPVGAVAAKVQSGAVAVAFDIEKIDDFLKYDSGNKTFQPLSTRNVSMAVDAVAICPTKLKGFRKEHH